MTHDIARQQDDLIRSLRGIDDAQVAGLADAALRDALMEKLVADPAPQPSWRQAHRRLAVTFAVAGAMVASTAAAYAGHEAWQRLNPDQSVTVGCVSSQDARHQPGDISVPVSTGDPLADCAAVWALQFGEEAPELAAYTGSNGTVMVQPKAWRSPTDWTPLAVGFTLDAALLELDHSLQDHVRGLPARCLATADGDALAEENLARLGLEGWKVEQRDDPDGVASCAAFVTADPQSKVVMLMAQEPWQGSGLPFEAMAATLRESPACLDHDQALAAVRQAGKQAGIPEGVEGYQLVEPGADSAASGAGGAEPDCTRIVMVVGGGVTVELWR